MAFHKSLDARIKTQDEGPYGAHQTLYNGFSHAGSGLVSAHPLEKSELAYHDKIEKMNLSLLRKTQGIHAPLRLMMERNAANKIQRLPCLPSSHLQYEMLTGRSETIDIKDVLNHPSYAELVGPPHIIMEKRLGIL